MTDSMPSSDDLKQRIERIFDELDPIQMAIFRQMSPAEKGRGVADMFTAMKQMALASERQRHPDLPETEIRKRAMARVMRVSEWEPWMRNIFSF
jgi:hypothetical protein